jgi:3-hydroxyisobutyrate dehydrogenase
MGTGIAGNILAAGFPLTVWNRTRDKAEPLLARGARWADTPAAAAAAADIVISVVANEPASRAVWLGESGALPAMPAHSLAIECSTLPVGWVQELHARAQARQLDFMDAPLGGSRQPAQAGTLTLFIGAEDAVLARARPVLEAFSSTILHFGPPAAATMYKLINNMMAAAHIAVLGEGIAMAERAGLNMETVGRAISIGPTYSPIVKSKVETVLARDFGDVHFALRWMHKDLTYALQAGTMVGAALPIVAAVREVFALAMLHDSSDLDFAAVTDVVRG